MKDEKKVFPKIFGIGLNKTGTSTLGECARILGYRSKSCDRKLLHDVIVKKDFSDLTDIVDQYDLFEDWPWPLIYKELDQMFPGSKFILTTRKNEDIWLESLKKHSMRRDPVHNSRKMAYGYSYPHGHEEEHLEIYRKHNSEVRSYFEAREKNFIELCWEKGDQWERLCRFLGDEIPSTQFPHANQAGKKERNKIRYFTNKLFSIFKMKEKR